MIRSTDPSLLSKPPFAIGFDAEALAGNPDNVLLTEDGSSGLFEKEGEGVFSGHYFFKRGEKSFDLASRMISEMFSRYGARAIKGLTPIDNIPALKLTRHLGFTSYGVLPTPAGPMELFILTKDKA